MNRILRRVAAWLSACALAACGGGGGGGADEFSVSLDTNRVDLTWSQANDPATATVRAVGRGSTSSRIFVGATTPSGQPDANIDHIDVVFDGSNAATATVFPANDLAPGTHTGTLLLQACYDNACVRPVVGSPFAVTYRFQVVAAELRTEPTAIDLSAFTGSAAKGGAQLLGNASGAGLTATPRDAWLQASIGRSANGVFLVVDATAGTVGTQTTTVDIVGNGQALSVPVTLHSNPLPLALEQAALALDTVQGSRCSGTARLTRLAYGATAYSASSTAPWLQITAQRELDFDVQAASLPTGTYSTTIAVRSGSEVEVLPVTCQVAEGGLGPARQLAVAQTSVTLFLNPGTTSDAVPLGVVRPSWNPEVQATVTYGAGAGGLSFENTPSGDLALRADAGGRPRGTYDATVTVSGAFPATPVTLNVRLTIGDFLAVPAPQRHVVNSDTSSAGGSLQPTGSAELRSWAASTATPWLRLVRAGGDMSTPLLYEVDLAQLASQPNYTDVTGQIEIEGSSSGGPTGHPVTATVTVRKELAELHSVAPATVVGGGQASTVVLRGRGFDALANPAAWLRANNQPLFAVRRLSDTDLEASVAFVSGQQLRVEMGNALGVPTSAVLVSVVTPRAYPAASLPTGGKPVSLLSDPLRRQVFVANPAAGGIQRWREQGGTWVADTLAIAGLHDIAFSTDGTELLAVTSAGRVQLVDPVSFTALQGFDGPSPVFPVPRTGHGMAVTNDQRLWMGTGTGAMTFDLRTRRFAGVTFDGVTPRINGGPWFEVAATGERLVAVQASDGPPALYMDASLGRWQENPAGPRFFYWSMNGLDHTGSHLLMMGSIWSSDFTFVGTAVTPEPWIHSASVLSPDGFTLYMFVLPPSWSIASSSELPRVLVYSVADRNLGRQFQLLGSFAVPEMPNCRVVDSSGVDCLHPVMASASDGRTLFIAGESRLLVLPVPNVLEPLPQLPLRARRLVPALRR